MCNKHFFLLVVGRAGGIPHGGAGGGGRQQHQDGGGVRPGAGGGLLLLVVDHRIHRSRRGRLVVPVGVGCVGRPLPTVPQAGPIRQVICNIHHLSYNNTQDDYIRIPLKVSSHFSAYLWIFISLSLFSVFSYSYLFSLYKLKHYLCLWLRLNFFCFISCEGEDRSFPLALWRGGEGRLGSDAVG
jgi:hypothetical protein